MENVIITLIIVAGICKIAKYTFAYLTYLKSREYYEETKD